MKEVTHPSDIFRYFRIFHNTISIYMPLNSLFGVGCCWSMVVSRRDPHCVTVSFSLIKDCFKVLENGLSGVLLLVMKS